MPMTNCLPDLNPNPVLRVLPDGRVAYANPAGRALVEALGGTATGPFDPGTLDRLRQAAFATPPQPVELPVGARTVSIRAITDDEAPGVLSLFGTDVTAARAIERFPDSNPNPVFRLSRRGELIYANPASTALLAGLRCLPGQPIPAELAGRIFRACESGLTLREESSGRSYDLKPVLVEEFDFINVYGTDVTAAVALTKFPDQNPNPVLRFAADGSLAYANPAAATIRDGLGLVLGGPLPDELWQRVQAAMVQPVAEPMEVSTAGRAYELTVVDVPQFEFINVYGTDVTAAREVEEAHRENERLLLNILPAPIAARLRGGETVIADEFDELTVLFADIAGFTELAAQLSATEVVQVLTDVFSACDELADRHGLEKIKTIGDAYMAVGGIGRDDADAPRRVAEMALDILDLLAAYRAPGERPLQVRIGLHTGPAVAGVMGIRKFFYDVWGDTVNTASRLESTAMPGTAQVLESTMERLRDVFLFEARGPVEMKGVGLRDTWLLTGRSPVAMTPQERDETA
jgi:class 3 adenylate cyclase